MRQSPFCNFSVSPYSKRASKSPLLRSRIGRKLSFYILQKQNRLMLHKNGQACVSSPHPLSIKFGGCLFMQPGEERHWERARTQAALSIRPRDFFH